MTFFEKRVALMARLDTLERHASALEATFKGGELKGQAGGLVSTLKDVKESLEGAPTTTALEEAEHALDAASLLLASIGRLR
jgi:hypothetical protein